MFGSLLQWIAGWIHPRRLFGADFGQHTAAREVAATPNPLSSLNHEIGDLRDLLEQQLRSAQDGLDTLDSIDERLAQVWNRHEKDEFDHLRLVAGILRVVDECRINVAIRSSPTRVLDLLEGILRDQGIEPIRVSAGDPFEPRLHYCEETVRDTQQPPGTIVKILETGYVRSESSGVQPVIRPARVIVTTDGGEMKRGKDDG